ncbi:MAG TPA: phage portal protein [Sedimentisphaerales bacterium]|nr:phage portal protein [Sedimentisphaerales bacterium]
MPAKTRHIKLLDRVRLAGRVFAASGVGYEVTRSSRLNRAFTLMAGFMASADRHQDKFTLGRLRELCRMHDRQSALFSGFLNRAVDNIFGAYFDFIPCTEDKELNKKIKDYITQRMEKRYCSADRLRDFSELARTALRAVWNDGDCLLVNRQDGSLSTFEADQIETPTDVNRQGNRIVMGVELGDDNQHLAYYVKQRKSRGDYGQMERTNENSTRVASQYAILPAYRKRYNQTRGVPFLAAILNRFISLNNYLNYESIAAEINSMLGWKIKKESGGSGYEMPGNIENTESKTESTFEKLQKMEPAMIFELMIGEDVEMIGSQRPGSNFKDYIIAVCRLMGAGLGYPLELMLLDFSQTNYSSARAALGEARRGFRVWQRFAQNHICVPWYRWQISRAIASGLLPAKPEIFKVRCQWPAWEYIDPAKEAIGNKIAVRTRTKSISECIRERGGEPEEVFIELKTERKVLKDLGIELPEEQLKTNEKGN